MIYYFDNKSHDPNKIPTKIMKLLNGQFDDIWQKIFQN